MADRVRTVAVGEARHGAVGGDACQKQPLRLWAFGFSPKAVWRRGVRRIEAVTGWEALRLAEEERISLRVG